LLIDLEKKIRIEREKQSLLTTNPLREIKHKLQLAMTDLKHLDEKILHATELMNKHLEDHSRQSLKKDSAWETPCGPGNGISSSSGTTLCEAEQNGLVQIDAERTIFTSVGSDVELSH
jgi:hypothetical protein